MNRNVGIQDVTTVTDSGVVDKDVHLAVTLKDLLCSVAHCLRLSQVEGHYTGDVCLQAENNKEEEKRIMLLQSILAKFQRLESCWLDSSYSILRCNKASSTLVGT